MNQEQVFIANKLIKRIDDINEEKSKAIKLIETLREGKYPSIDYNEMVSIRDFVENIYNSKIRPIESELEAI